MSGQRLVVFFVEDFQAAEDLTTAIDMARQPPWKPNETGRFGDPQVRYTREEVDPWILERLIRSAPKIKLGAEVIVP